MSLLSTEKGEIKSKTEALKKVIIMILNGEKLPGLLMTIIRFVLPLQDHTIKKLLLVFWEIVPKTTTDGKLLQEMILVCDAYRKVGLTVGLIYPLDATEWYVSEWTATPKSMNVLHYVTLLSMNRNPPEPFSLFTQWCNGYWACFMPMHIPSVTWCYLLFPFGGGLWN